MIQAQQKDLSDVMALFHALIHAPYGTWSEEYPSCELLAEDVTMGRMYILRDPEGSLLGAIAMEESGEFDGMAPWYPDVRRWVQFARLGVAPHAQGKGIARMVMRSMLELARENGYEAVRFLVAKGNVPALRSYSAFGFDICGQTLQWGDEWLCYQKRL